MTKRKQQNIPLPLRIAEPAEMMLRAPAPRTAPAPTPTAAPTGTPMAPPISAPNSNKVCSCLAGSQVPVPFNAIT